MFLTLKSLDTFSSQDQTDKTFDAETKIHRIGNAKDEDLYKIISKSFNDDECASDQQPSSDSALSESFNLYEENNLINTMGYFNPLLIKIEALKKRFNKMF